MKDPEPPFALADPVTTVIGADGAEYSCADICALDEHISRLCDRIARAAHGFPSHVESFRADIDLLLDRRCWLRLSEESAPSSPSEPGVAI